MIIRGTVLAAGSPTPGLAVISGGYAYRGRRGWPDDPATRDPAPGGEAERSRRGREYAARRPAGQPPAAVTARQKRLAEYDAARRSGLSKEQAAALIRIAPRTASTYEAEYLAGKDKHEDPVDC